MTSFAFFHPICFTILGLGAMVTLIALAILHGGVQYIDTFQDRRKP
jgi:hypothetical protein